MAIRIKGGEKKINHGKQVLRVCVSCKKKFDRKDLIRILQEHKTKSWIASPTSKNFGRSIYLCNTESCINKLSKNKKYSKLIEVIKQK